MPSHFYVDSFYKETVRNALYSYRENKHLPPEFLLLNVSNSISYNSILNDVSFTLEDVLENPSRSSFCISCIVESPAVSYIEEEPLC